MKTNQKLSVKQKGDLLKSLNEKDVVQLRIQLNDIHINFENELINYNMNTNEVSINFLKVDILQNYFVKRQPFKGSLFPETARV